MPMPVTGCEVVWQAGDARRVPARPGYNACMHRCRCKGHSPDTIGYMHDLLHYISTNAYGRSDWALPKEAMTGVQTWRSSHRLKAVALTAWRWAACKR